MTWERMAELPHTDAELAALTAFRHVGANTAIDSAASAPGSLERLAYLSGGADAARNEIAALVDELRADGVVWTSIAFALGEISDPTDAQDRFKGARRVQKVAWRKQRARRDR